MKIVFWSLTILNLVLFFVCGLLGALGVIDVVFGATTSLIALLCAGFAAVQADRASD